MQLSISTPESIKRSNIDDTRLLSIFSIALLFTAFLHHAAFCFINTHLFAISTKHLVLTELSFLAVTSIFFIRNVELPYLILLIFVFANTFILAVFQGGFDPKSIRNFMIPILMVWLGSRYDNRIHIDTIFKWLAWIFLIFGLFELIFIDFFQEVFNVIKFQYAVGRMESEEVEFINGTFSANGQRYNGRNFLAFLGSHRVASVFLETVNTSNFCTLLVAWGLSKRTVREGWQFYAIGLFIALLSDSRFGVTLISVMTVLRVVFSTNLLKLTSYFSPVLVLFACFYLGWEFTEFRDDFVTRLGSTGNDILNFRPNEFFGLHSVHYKSFVDQGYARLLHFNGLVLVLVLWISFCRLPVINEGVLFKCFIAIIISANLAISGDSVFAFKWVTILWFLLGSTLITKNKGLS